MPVDSQYLFLTGVVVQCGKLFDVLDHRLRSCCCSHVRIAPTKNQASASTNPVLEYGIGISGLLGKEGQEKAKESAARAKQEHRQQQQSRQREQSRPLRASPRRQPKAKAAPELAVTPARPQSCPLPNAETAAFGLDDRRLPSLAAQPRVAGSNSGNKENSKAGELGRRSGRPESGKFRAAPRSLSPLNNPRLAAAQASASAQAVAQATAAWDSSAAAVTLGGGGGVGSSGNHSLPQSFISASGSDDVTITSGGDERGGNQSAGGGGRPPLAPSAIPEEFHMHVTDPFFPTEGEQTCLIAPTSD